MKPPITTSQNLILRPFKQKDASLWQIWDIDSEIQAHMPEPKNEPQDISVQYEYIQECEDDESGLYWSIDTNNGQTIGTVALTDINEHHKTAELGIVIGDKSYHGKGFASEVIQAVIKYAFENLKIMRISAEVEEDNIAMKKVLEKIGFEQDGYFKEARVKGDRRVGVMHFGICK